MLNLRRSMLLVLASGCLVASSAASYGQDADADKAKSMLRKGIAQFNALAFKQAKATLLEVNRDDLPDTDKGILDEYLSAKLDPAIKKQMAAMAAYKQAEKAGEAGDLQKAKQGFRQAAASEYLPATMRQDAQAQLALIDQKIAVALAAAEATKKQKALAKPSVSNAPVVRKATDKAVKKVPDKSAPAPITQPAASADAKVAAVKNTSPVGAEAKAKKAKSRKMLDDLRQRQSRAKELVAMGQKALDQNQPERAAGYFQRALALAPENEEARRQLNYARSMTATVGQTGILTQMENRRRIARQVADAKFDSAISRSQELLAAADSATGFNRAESAGRSARSLLETSKTLYSETEYRQRLIRAEDQLNYVKAKQDEWGRLRVQQEVQEIVRREKLRQIREQEQRRRTITSLTERIKALRSQGKYVQALEIAKQILRLEPINSWAAEQVEMLDQFVLLQEEKQVRDDQRLHEKRQLIDIRRAEIPWWELLRYPRDWKELTVRREPYQAGRGAESQVDRAVRQQLERQISKADFDGIEFEEVIDWLRTYSGQNIFVKWDALEMAGIERSKEINVNLSEVTFEKVLQIVLDDAGGVTPLSYVIDGGVITISTQDDLSTRTFVRVYDIRDLIVRVPNFQAPDMGTASGQNAGGGGGNGGGFGGGGGGGGGGRGGGNNANDNTPTRQELIDDIISLVSETIDPDSWPPAGNVGSIRELHGQLVITQTAKNHKDFVDLIKQLREARSLQIAIEARFISVNSGFLNSIGIDLDFYFNLGSRLGSTSVTDPWTGATVPTTGGSSGWGNSLPGSNKMTPLSFRQDSLGFTSMLGGSTPISGSIGGQISNAALSLGGTFLDDIQVDFLIEATQAHSATRSLTAPRLTLFNGQQAYVAVETTQWYVSDLVPVVSDNAIAFNPVLASIGSGTRLQVEAVVSADRRYVTLTVWPRVTVVNGFQTYFVNVATTDPAGNPLTGTGRILLPSITYQEVRTTVSVPDGGTLLLGGQRLSGEVEREKGVPLLNKIPFLNRAFSNRGSIRDEQTLLILIKPKIIIHEEEEDLQYPD